MIAFFLRTDDQAAAARLRIRFRATGRLGAASAIPERLFTEPSVPDIPPVTVVVPVYNAAQDVKTLLEVLPEALGTRVKAILVDDSSTDPEIAPMLFAFASQHPGVSLLRHSQNLGFVASANAGVAAADPSDHIVLLNTDTLPPPGWLSRLIAPIAHDPNVASATPFSNNAEILSVPSPGIFTDPDADTVAALDKVAARLSSPQVSLPTGIGFCMAMNRGFLDRIGGFDPAFGRGYGEEVDWCRRAIAAGGRHVAAGLFVGHRGGASFGETEKAARIRASSRLIAKRYPAYDREVQDWIAEAPLGAEKLALDVAWLAEASSGPVQIFLGHSLGGGAEMSLRNEIAEADQPGCIVLRVGGPRRWRVELHGQDFVLAGDATNATSVLELLAPVRERHVVYSCGVGAIDPAMVPRLLLDLAPSQLDLRLHDFFPVSPSWNLLDSRGRFCGIPDLDTTDRAHRVPSGPGRLAVSHREWRSLWGTVLNNANRITVYAPSSRNLLSQAYPQVRDQIDVQPHDLPSPPRPIHRGGQSIGVLGGINLPKGGMVLEGLSRVTSRRIVVIGEMDGKFRLARPHVVHGPYDREDIGRLARSYDIGLWLIPSVCPETFSFATHEALATGLPVLTFPIGAQADAARAAENGFLITSPIGDNAALSWKIETLWPAAGQSPPQPTTSRAAS